MDDLISENSKDRTGTKWRLKLPADQSGAVFDGPVVFELTDASGPTLASICMPPETIDELLRPHLSIFMELQLDGSVSMSSEFFALSSPQKTIDILDLVRQALTPEMLEDEPETAQMLCKFRDRLLKSLEHVERAIALLPKA